MEPKVNLSPTIRRRTVLPVIVLTLAACGSSAGLTDQTWMLTEVGGTPAVETAISTLTFTDGTITGNTGCNGFSTTYEESGSSMVINPAIAATLMACDPAVMTQEASLFEAFANTAKFEISGSELQLMDDAGGTLARYSSESE
jgi:heat shock protein HslJ